MLRISTAAAIALIAAHGLAAAEGVTADENTDTTLPSAQGDMKVEESGAFTATGEARMADTMTTDIFDTVTAEPDLSTLARAIHDAGLIKKMKSDGPYTVFAPTNEAFEALPEGELDEILGDEARVTALVEAHVVDGALQAEALDDGRIVETMGGTALEVGVDGDSVSIGDANVLAADVIAANGVIHVVDRVLATE